MSLPFIDYLLLAKTAQSGSTTLGSLYLWGTNTFGLLGDNGSATYYSWSQIAVGSGHTIAIRSDGVLFGWGRNDYGQLGDGTTVNKSLPTMSGQGQFTRFVSVAAGETHSVALTEGDQMFTWGGNRYGQLATGDTVARSFPFGISTSYFTLVAAGKNHTLGFTETNNIVSVGYNGFGQLGDGTTVNKSSVVTVPGTTVLSDPNAYSLVVSAQTGIVTPVSSQFALTSTDDFTIECWFYLTAANLGYATLILVYDNTSGPIIRFGDVGYGYKLQVTLNQSTVNTVYSCSLTQTAALNTWYHVALVRQTNTCKLFLNGVQQSINSGANPTTYPLTSFASSDSTASSTTKFIVGSQTDYFTGYISNIRYVVGNAVYTGNFTVPASPLTDTQTSGTNINAITSGQTKLLTAQNALIVDNSSLHNSITTYGATQVTSSLSTPFASVTQQSNQIKKLAAGGNTSFAIDSSNNLFAWGENTYGQLGAGDTVHRSNIFTLAAGSWALISGGASHTVGIKQNGTLYTWGSDDSGQLGRNSIGSKSNFISIHDGGDHFLALDSNYKLWAWGSNSFGQLGTNDTITRSSPVQIGNSSWTSVSGGASYSMGITSTGKLFAWGHNTDYQYGDNSTVSRSSPVQVTTLSSWSVVSAGDVHSMALRTDGTLWGWGTNTNGQIGGAVNSTGFSWTKIVSSASHTVGLRADGTLWAWGLNNTGQVGDNTTITRSAPVQIDTGLTEVWKDIAVGASHSLAITATKIYGWGKNDVGQTGTYSWTYLATGASHTAMVRSDKSVWTYGNNQYGQLGDGTTISRSNPIQIASFGTSTANKVFAGTNTTFAINSDFSVYSWGYNNNGQLGLGDTINRSAPAQIPASFSPLDISARDYTLFREIFTNLLYAVGTNTSGQLGTGDTLNRSIPVQIGTNSWLQVAAGTATVGAAIDGTLWTWGDNTYGQLGLNDRVSRSIPTQVGSSSWNVVASSVTGHSAAIDINGNLFTWGNNQYGELGIYETGYINRSNPTQVNYPAWGVASPGFNTYDSIQLGANTTFGKTPNVTYRLAAWGNNASGQLGQSLSWVLNGSSLLHSDGALWWWGSNNYGQLGINSRTNQNSPVAVLTTDKWLTTTRSYYSHAMGTTADGETYAWGYNAYGQLGTGDTISRSSPVAITSSLGYGVSKVITGNGWSSFIIYDVGNYAAAAGLNSNGQLGVGDVVNRSVFTDIPGTWKSIAGNAYTTYGVQTDGTLWSWGRGVDGQLGVIPIVARRSDPIQVGALTNWASVSDNIGGTFALNTLGQLFVWGADNTSGQLGTGDTLARSSPVQIGTTSSWTQVMSRGGVSLGLTTANTLFAWGDNSNGMLGIGSTINRSTPTQITGSWTQMALIDTFGALHGHAVATDTTGKVWSWGLNTGLNDGIARSAPVQLDDNSKTNYPRATVSDVTMYGAGSGHMVTIPYNKYPIRSWGVNSSGQLGVGDTITRSSPAQIGSGLGNALNLATRSTPTQLTFPLSSFTSVDAGDSHSVVYKADRSLWIFGDNQFGQYGTNTTSWSMAPATPSFSGTSTLLGVRSMANWNIAVTTNNTLYTWGQNNAYQLGTMNTLNRSAPVQLMPALRFSNVMAAGGTAGYAVSTSTSNYTLYTWGTNAAGQLGTNDTVIRSSPTQIGNSYTFLSAGQSHVVGRTSDGTYWTWGDNTYGQLNTGDTLARSAPVQLVAESPMTILGDSEFGLNIGLTGLAVAVGRNTSGQLGDTSTVNKSSYVIVSSGTPTTFNTPTRIGLANSWSNVQTGYSHTIALRNDGAVFTWGTNTSGQLGITLTTHRSSPTQINTSSYTIIAAGKDTSGVIAVDKTLWTWGLSTSGQTGFNSTISRSGPIQVAGGSWIALGLGPTTGAAIAENNVVWSWGTNSFGQLGTNDKITRSVPTQIAGSNYVDIALGTNNLSVIDPFGRIYVAGQATSGQIGDNYRFYFSWVQLTAGERVTALIRDDRQLLMWGDNTFGQLALPSSITARNLPVQVSGSWTVVSVKHSHALAIDTTGNLWAWGLNTTGQLGTGDISTRYYTSLISTSSWIAVGTGQQSSHGIKLDGTYWAWGKPTTTISSSSPIQIGSKNNWVSVFAGGNATSLDSAALIDSNSSLYLYGYNSAGQLGLGDTVDRTDSPVQLGTSSWSMISIGGNHTMGITVDGKLFAWGNNTYGQLGVQQSFTNLTSSAGNFGIRSDNAVYAWGYNSYYQLGTGDSLHRSSPTQVLSNISWAMLASDIDTSYGIKVDGTLWTWGRSEFGQSGLNSTIVRSSPTQIGTSNSWVSVAAGYKSVYAIDNGSNLYAWGLNSLGQLGISGQEYVSLSSPTQVGTSWQSIYGGKGFVLAKGTNGNLYGWGDNTYGQLGIDNIITSWSSIASGDSHSLLLRNDGMLFAMGDNTYGQLGIPNTGQRLVPFQVTNSSWTKIAASKNSSFAIDPTGLLFSWGLNYAGVLGFNDTINRSSPTQVGTSSWLQVASSGASTFVIRNDNTLWSWGANLGQFAGLPLLATRSAPVQITGLGTGNYVKLSSGNNNLFVIDSNSALYSLGDNKSGQLGQPYTGPTSWNWTNGAFYLDRSYDNDTVYYISGGILYGWGKSTYNSLLQYDDTISYSFPVQISPDTDWSTIFRGDEFTVAMKTNSTVWTWGRNQYGQLGLNDTIDRSSPTQISATTYYNIHAAGAVMMLGGAGGGSAACYMCGRNDYGQLGDGTTLHRSSPVVIASPANPWYGRILTNGESTVLFNDSALVLQAWGRNNYGQLGLGNTLNRSFPVQVTTIASGGYGMFTKSGTLGVLSGTTLSTCGLNASGQLGANSTVNRSALASVSTTATELQAGNDNFIFRNSSTNLFYAMGKNDKYQLGLGDTLNRSAVTQIAGLTASTNNIGMRGDWGYADNGSKVWGLNAYGQLGLGDTTARSTPAIVSGYSFYSSFTMVGTSSWSMVSAGKSHTAGIDILGNLYTWGDNSLGQLGLSDTLNRSVISQVSAGSSFATVSAGSRNTYAITTTGSIFAWGNNTFGQLGQSNTINRSAPIQIGASSWNIVSAGDSYVVATDSTARVFTIGQVGSVATNAVSSPTQVASTFLSPTLVSTSSWTMISTGEGGQHVIGLKDDGVFSWGNNSRGQLGVGDTLNRSAPTQVTSSTASLVKANNINSLYISEDLMFVTGDNTYGQLGQNNIVSRSAPVQLGTTLPNAYSILLNGTSQAIQTTSTTVTPTSQDFTMECWFNLTSNLTYLLTGGSGYASRVMSGIGTGSMECWIASGSTTDTTPRYLSVGTYNATGVSLGSGALNIPLNTWHHWAFSRTGSTFSLWFNGVRVATTTSTYTYTTARLAIGGSANAAAGYLGYFPGYFTNTRLVIGSSVYDANLSTITVPTSPLTAIANTAFLSCQSATIVDNSTNAYAITNTGGVTVSGNTPFQTTATWIYGSIGESYILATRLSDKALYGMGLNQLGAIGDNTSINRSTPTQVALQLTQSLSSPVQVGTDYWSYVSAGESFTVGLKSNNTLWAWGLNSSGQYGIGDTISRSLPVQINSSVYTLITAGGTHTVALDTNQMQSVYAWGYNAQGQLGTGLTTNRSAPTQVYADGLYGYKSSPTQIAASTTFDQYSSLPTQIGNQSWIAASAGYKHTTAVSTDYILFAWGQNSFGNLGDSTTINRSSPVQISAGVSGVAAGLNYTLNNNTDGSAYGFGDNSYGQLGDGT